MGPARHVHRRLTVNGQTYTQPLTVRMDPRVKASASTLARQFALSKGVYDDIDRTRGVLDELRALRTNLRELRQRRASATRSPPPSIRSIARPPRSRAAAGGFGGGGGGGRASDRTYPRPEPSVSSAQLYGALQEADVQPTTQLVAAVQTAQRQVPTALGRWDTLHARATSRLGAQLRPLGPPK